ncbi:hypothetical protein O988_09163, partial [Pseudogymnoascus sp. VKM F-3808]
MYSILEASFLLSKQLQLASFSHSDRYSLITPHDGSILEPDGLGANPSCRLQTGLAAATVG